MAKSVRLDDLRELARFYADERTDGAVIYVDDDECTKLINQAIGEYYDMLVAARGHEHFRAETDITTVSGTNEYAVPADFMQATALTIKWGSREWEPIHDYKWEEQARLQNWGVWGREGTKAYRIVGQNIRIIPTPTSAATITMEYVPTFTDMALDADTFNFENGWEKVVCLTAAIEMKMIQNESTSQLVARREDNLDRIRKAAEERAAAEPHRIVDTFPEGQRRRWFPISP